jgi:hypothetical protein
MVSTSIRRLSRIREERERRCRDRDLRRSGPPILLNRALAVASKAVAPGWIRNQHDNLLFMHSN